MKRPITFFDPKDTVTLTVSAAGIASINKIKPVRFRQIAMQEMGL